MYGSMPIPAARCARALIAAVLLALPAPARSEAADFAGHYAGTYVDEGRAVERGTWCASIAGDGTVGGSVHSDVTGRDYPVAGTVTDSGGVALSAGQTGGGSSFSGTIEADGRVEGTWQSDAAPDRFHGTFEGSREADDGATPCGRPSARLQLQRPALAVHAVAEPVLLDFVDQHESGRLIDPAG